MKRFFLRLNPVGWILLTVLAVCTACAGLAVEKKPTPTWDASNWKAPLYLPEDAVMTVRRGGSTMLMAVTDIVFGDYIVDHGGERRDWTAVLTIQFINQPETRRTFDIFRGKSVFFDKFKITILDVIHSRNGLLVEVDITQA